MQTRGVPLTDDLSSDSAIPYFLWDEPMTMGELRRRLGTSEEARIRLLGKIMREARDRDVWLFTSPREVVASFARLEPHLGRRKDFWRFLITQWRGLGLLD
jgi:hypothetical protein